MFGCSTYGKQVTQYLDDLPGRERPGDLNGQAFASKLVDHHQQSDLSAVFNPIGNKVV
jgi:hypothetical protein